MIDQKGEYLMTDWTQVKKAFKAYDIRGRLPAELNPAMAYRLGQAFAKQLTAKNVVVAGMSGYPARNWLTR